MSTPGRSPWRRRLADAWSAWFSPISNASAYARDQTLLLSGLLLTLVVLSLVAVAYIWLGPLHIDDRPQHTLVALVAGALLAGAYGLNRQGRYRPAALLSVAITALAIWASLLSLPPKPDNDVIVLAYLTVPLLLAGLLLPFGPTLAVAAGSAVVLLRESADGTLLAVAPGAIIYLILISGLILGVAALRERQAVELERGSLERAQSVAQFQSAFEYAAVGMALVALDGRWLRANRSLCQLLGYTEAELQALDFQSVTHPEDLQAGLSLVRQLLAGEIENYQVEKRYMHKQGHAVWTSLSVSLVRSANGTPLHFISQIQDFSERKRVEDALRASEARFRTLSNASPIGIYETDAQGNDVYQNARWLNLTGLRSEEALGDGWLKAVHPDDRERLEAEWQRAVRERRPFAMEFRFVHRDGQVHWVQSRATPLFDDVGAMKGYVGTVADITERKASELALQSANERMSGWVNELEQHTREIGLLNELSNLLQSCLTAEEAYGILKQIGRQLFPQQIGLLGMTNASRNLIETVAAWGDEAAVHQAGPGTFAPEDCWALRRGRPHWYEAAPGAVRCLHVGADTPATYLCLPMMAHGETLGILHLRAGVPGAPALSASRRTYAQTVADSVSLALANLKLRERLRDQSIRDPVTGLYNRRYLEETLDRELRRAERDRQSVGVLMLDIDYFKRFNDSFGHAAGDEVLRALGRLFSRLVRMEDIACRYGGEEFTLVLPGCSLERVCERAEQLREQVRDLHVTHAGQPLGGITISVGVAVFPQHGQNETSLLRAADSALYLAKQAGRNRVVVAPVPG